MSNDTDATPTGNGHQTLYRVTCFKCDPEGAGPLYEGPDEKIARRRLASAHKVAGHSVRMQRAAIAWEDVDE